MTRNPTMPGTLVALTATTKDIGGMMRVRLNEAYVEAVREAGLTPLIVPPLPANELSAIADAVAGIVLTGGEDVAPSHYGAVAGAATTSVHAKRDECELALARLAHDRRIPTLAICRGIQLVNVAFGGTLVQDIPSERPSGIRHDLAEQRAARVHDVRVDPDSRLGRIVGAETIQVNSSHHQAIGKVADRLRVSARAPDGIIEGAEWIAEDWWMLAVQWHPEELTRDGKPWDRALFKTFAARVSED
jgi:putative glutamine amidotransferase